MKSCNSKQQNDSFITKNQVFGNNSFLLFGVKLILIDWCSFIITISQIAIWTNKKHLIKKDKS